MNNISLLFDVGSVLRVCLTAYCGLLVYNFISAVLGLCLLRRFYVGLLRRLYRVHDINIEQSSLRCCIALWGMHEGRGEYTWMSPFHYVAAI